MAIFELRCNRFTWINIISPTRADIEHLSELHRDIHPLHLEDLVSHTERPKFDEEDTYLFIVMHFPVWDSVSRISRASEVEFILGRNYLVTVHDGRLKPLVRLFARCELYESERDLVFGKGANDAFYSILDQLVDYVFPMLRKVDANIHQIEDTIFDADAREVIRDIAEARRDVIALRRMIRHQVPIVEALERTEHHVIREELEAYFGDIVDHLNAARDIIDENYEVISGLAETADTLLSHRINEVMRVLTVISVILLPLTLISGIYGMNIDLPLNEHPDAFIFVTSLMIAVVVMMLVYFRRRKWI
ncbi:MAG: magnesium/cobalt transporter CorA [Anaerolineae bacterium]|nr:magnesium/cobalt transporter CorA [Anaerolineae bacterium]